MKGILRIVVNEEDEEAILEALWEIIDNIHKDPDLLNEHVDFDYNDDVDEEDEDYDLMEEYDEE